MSFTLVLRSMAYAALIAFSTAVAVPMAAVAQTDDPSLDPPGLVGRLSHTEGTVSFRSDDTENWVPATLNLPITTGNELWTEPGARAEVQIGAATLRLDQTTAVEVLELDDDATVVQIDQGAINYATRDLPTGGVRIETPRGPVTLLQPGRYNIDAGQPPADGAPGWVKVTVLEGQARLEALTSPLIVNAGHSAAFADPAAPPTLGTALVTAFDDWAMKRDGVALPQVQETTRYVSPQMTGYQDLARHGQWVQDTTYGPMWYPTVTAVDWAPYRYGHWAYIRPWGWTWIDHEPWGFAPFHYGRWIHHHGRWAWCPGQYVRRPVYAPALVVFIGTSRHRHHHHVGWVPLGPHEVYHPHYRSSTTHIRNVNITNVNKTVINNITVQRNDDVQVARFRNRQAATVVAAESFTGAKPVHKTRVALRDEEMAEARRTRSLDDLRPSRIARAGIAAPVAASTSAVVPGRDRDASRDGSRRRDAAERDQVIAPPSQSRLSRAPEPRVASTTSSADVVPKAPGPDRERRTANRDPRERPRPPASARSQMPDAAPTTATPRTRTAPAAAMPTAPDAKPDNNRRERAAPGPTPPPETRSPDRRPDARTQPPGRAPDRNAIGTNEPPGRTPTVNRAPQNPPGRTPNEQLRPSAPAPQVVRPRPERQDNNTRREIAPAPRNAPGAAPHPQMIRPTRPENAPRREAAPAIRQAPNAAPSPQRPATVAPQPRREEPQQQQQQRRRPAQNSEPLRPEPMNERRPDAPRTNSAPSANVQPQPTPRLPAIQQAQPRPEPRREAIERRPPPVVQRQVAPRQPVQQRPEPRQQPQREVNQRRAEPAARQAPPQQTQRSGNGRKPEDMRRNRD